MNKIKLLAVGSDPEAFLFVNGKPMSAIGLVPGSKDSPYNISDHESVQVDNVAIEFNIKPTLDPDEFHESLVTCASWMNEHLSKINPLIQVRFTPSAEFDSSELTSRAARTFGCDPDFNAWTGMINPRPKADSPNLRSCGGHIHIGFDVPKGMDDARLIRLMDEHVGLYTAAICGDKRRMSLYGKAGAFRTKSYGVEYRTPSNTWLNDISYIREVFRRINLAIDAYNEGLDADFIVKDLIDRAEVEEIKLMLKQSVLV